jgi:transcription elongation factor GreB
VSEPNYITVRGLERIQREVAWLEKEERPRIVAEVAYAASLGDRSENAEYIYGKKRLREIDGRRHFLLRRLEAARPVDPALLSGPVVRFGATVTVEEEDGRERTWHIYGVDEVDVAAGIVSWRSPIGRALLDKREGDTVVFEAPAGRRELVVLSVAYRAQEPLPENLRFPSQTR